MFSYYLLPLFFFLYFYLKYLFCQWLDIMRSFCWFAMLIIDSPPVSTHLYEFDYGF